MLSLQELKYLCSLVLPYEKFGERSKVCGPFSCGSTMSRTYRQKYWFDSSACTDGVYVYHANSSLLFCFRPDIRVDCGAGAAAGHAYGCGTFGDGVMLISGDSSGHPSGVSGMNVYWPAKGTNNDYTKEPLTYARSLTVTDSKYWGDASLGQHREDFYSVEVPHGTVTAPSVFADDAAYAAGSGAVCHKRVVSAGFCVDCTAKQMDEGGWYEVFNARRPVDPVGAYKGGANMEGTYECWGTSVFASAATLMGEVSDEVKVYGVTEGACVRWVPREEMEYELKALYPGCTIGVGGTHPLVCGGASSKGGAYGGVPMVRVRSTGINSKFLIDSWITIEYCMDNATNQVVGELTPCWFSKHPEFVRHLSSILPMSYSSVERPVVGQLLAMLKSIGVSWSLEGMDCFYSNPMECMAGWLLREKLESMKSRRVLEKDGQVKFFGLRQQKFPLCKSKSRRARVYVKHGLAVDNRSNVQLDRDWWREVAGMGPRLVQSSSGSGPDVSENFVGTCPPVFARSRLSMLTGNNVSYPGDAGKTVGWDKKVWKQADNFMSKDFPGFDFNGGKFNYHGFGKKGSLGR